MEDAPVGFDAHDLVEGSGREARSGDRVKVSFQGWIEGTKALEGGESELTLGRGEVIEAWDIGIEGMKVGGKRRLIVPPALGYRALGLPDKGIGPDTVLVFEIELLEVAT